MHLTPEQAARKKACRERQQHEADASLARSLENGWVKGRGLKKWAKKLPKP